MTGSYSQLGKICGVSPSNSGKKAGIDGFLFSGHSFHSGGSHDGSEQGN